MDELRYQVDLLNAMNGRLQADERMYRLVCATSSSAIIYIDLEKGTVNTLGAFSEFFPDVEIHDINDISKLYSYIEEQSVLLFRDLIFLEKTTEVHRDAVFKLSGRRAYIECAVDLVKEMSDSPNVKIIRITDVSKTLLQNEELTYMAYYDFNTGLMNRNYFVSKLTDFVSKANNEKAMIQVMFFDLDSFHTINDSMGIVIGDEVVQTFGQILKVYESEDVLVSHFNADVYCLAIYNPKGNVCADCIFSEVSDKCKDPIKLTNGNEVRLSFTAGVAEYPESALTSLELINCAEIVLFKAKKKGRGQIQYFDAPILSDFLTNANIENKLKDAVFNSNFIMNFQPQYYADSKRLRGFEALIRWKDDDGTMIPPSLFIPIAETNGTIIPIGNFVIEDSIKNFVEWKEKYNLNITLSLNISAVQYRAEDFVQNLLDIINKYEIDPFFIELEITETILIEDFTDVVNKLEALRSFGIKVSLDDFGTGYSSLSYLKGLPIDTLKIDKAFVDTVSFDSNTRIIIETIVYMSKKLGFETVAEGVEDQKQFDYLKSIGCDCIQGYFFGKPMDSESVDRLLLSESMYGV